MTLVPELFVRRLNKPKGLPINVRDVSVTGDGQTDDYAALNEAVRSAGATGTLYFPAGTYVVGTNLTIPACCIFAFGAKLKPSSGITVTLSGPVETAPGESVIASGTAGTVSITGSIESSGGVVDVRSFGAVGDGVTDDTAAIQRAIDTGRDVVFPAASYLISAPLQVGSQRLIGGVQDKLINRAQTIITVPGNHAGFVNKAGEPSFEIDGFWVNFGDTTPTNELTQGLKMGFKFTTNTLWPAFIAIRNCTVRGAWEGVFDNTGTYQAIYERMFVRDSKRGFLKQNGTTVEFNTCFAIGGEQGFYIDNVLSCTIINSGADQMTPSVLRNTANYFKDVAGLTIVGWGAESNVISGNTVSYMRFDNTVGSVGGFYGYQNTMNCVVAEESYFMWAQSDSRVQFTGCLIATDSGDLQFLGSSGTCATIVATSNAQLTLVSSNFSAPTGGTPVARYSALTDQILATIATVQTVTGGSSLASEIVVRTTGGQVAVTSAALAESGSAPSAIANSGVIFTEDNGSGKTRLMVRFGTGASQQIAIEP